MTIELDMIERVIENAAVLHQRLKSIRNGMTLTTPDETQAASDFFAARTTVETALIDHAKGKKPISAEDARKLIAVLHKLTPIRSNA